MNNHSAKKDQTVGVVLVNWNGAEHTVSCIQSLLGGSIKPDKVVVVDNASHDGSPDKIVQRFPTIELIRNRENLGFTGANNLGISRLMESGCAYIWILNNDTVIDEACLAVLKEHMETHPEVAACTGKILYTEPDRRIWYAGAVYNSWTLQVKHRGEGEDDAGQYDETEKVLFISGCCMFVRRSALELIGVFDDHFFAYAEDSDWCLRATRAHLRLHYIPQAVIWHKVSASVNTLKKEKTGGTTSPFSVYITSRNRLYIVRKHSVNFFRTGIAFLALGVRFFYYAAALLVLLRVDKFRALAMAVYDGVTEPLDSLQARPLKPRYLR